MGEVIISGLSRGRKGASDEPIALWGMSGKYRCQRTETNIVYPNDPAPIAVFFSPLPPNTIFSTPQVLTRVCVAVYKPRMNFEYTPSLFGWDRLDDSPDLFTVRRFFEALPAEQLLSALRQRRGRGRDDYPVKRLLFVTVRPTHVGVARRLP